MKRLFTTIAVVGLLVPVMASAADNGRGNGRFGGDRAAQAQNQGGGGNFGNRGFGGRGNFNRGGDTAVTQNAAPQGNVNGGFRGRGNFDRGATAAAAPNTVAPNPAPQRTFAPRDRAFGGRANNFEARQFTPNTAPAAAPNPQPRVGANNFQGGNRGFNQPDGNRGNVAGRGAFDNRNFGNRNFDNRNFGNRNFDNRNLGNRNFGNNHRDFRFNRPNTNGRYFTYRGRQFAQVRVRPFYYPRGFTYRRYYAGSFLPTLFLTQQYFFDEFYDVGLPPPPPGTRWIEYGPDALLVDVFTGQVIDVIYDVFYW